MKGEGVGLKLVFTDLAPGLLETAKDIRQTIRGWIGIGAVNLQGLPTLLSLMVSVRHCRRLRCEICSFQVRRF